jgi:hypothetical protein
MVTAVLGVCGVCAHSATVVDWTPIQGWVAVEGCSCGGFFISKTLWEGRLPGMAERECQELAARIRNWRAGGREAWISTTDGTLTGLLVVFPERPAVSTDPIPPARAPDSTLTPRFPG